MLGARRKSWRIIFCTSSSNRHAQKYRMKCRTIWLLIVLQLLTLNVTKSVSQQYDNVDGHQDGPGDLQNSVPNNKRQDIEIQLESVAKRQNAQNLNYLQQQMARITRARSRSRIGQRRMHEALIRARWQQLSNQGLTDNQLKTQRTSTSSVSTYSASQLHYLQTTVSKLTSNVQKLTVKLEDLQAWKAESEERTLRMEKAIQQMQRLDSEHLDYNINVGDELDEETLADQTWNLPDRDIKDRRSILNECLTRVDKLEKVVLKVNESVENMKHSDHGGKANYDGNESRSEHNIIETGYGNLLNQVRLNVASIMNLTRISASQQETIDKQKSLIDVLQNRMLFQRQQVIEANNKNDKQDKILKAITTNSYIQVSNKASTESTPMENITMRSSLEMTTAGEIKEVVKSVDDLREVMNSHEKSITRIYMRLRNTQRCCRISTVVVKRIGIVERRIKEARIRADSSLRVAKGNRKRIDAMTGKLETQKMFTKELQTASRDHDRLTSESNQRILELIESHQNALNETMGLMIAEYMLKSENNFEKISEIDEIVHSLITDLEYMNVFMNEQVLQMNDTKYDLEVFVADNLVFNSEIQENLTQAQERISTRERELRELLLTVADMQMQVNHHEDVFQNHTENIRQNSNHVENSMDLLLTREEMETKLKSSVENIHNIVRNFTNNITELVTVSRFRDNQMKELRSIVQASQSLNEISDSEIRAFDSKLTKLSKKVRDLSIGFSDEISAVYSNCTQSCSLTVDVMAMSMNLTLQKYRTEQATILKTNENRERALEELGQRTNDIENRQVKISKIMEQHTVNISSRIADLENELKTNTNNLTGLDIQIGNMENKLETTILKVEDTNDSQQSLLQKSHDTREELNRTREFFAEKLKSLQILLQEIEEDTVANLSNSVIELTNYVREQNKTTNEQEVERQQTKSLLINRYADLDEKCDQRSEKIIADVNTLRKELDFNIETVYDNCAANMVKIEQRISNLERSNSSIHLDVANGLLEISTIKAGLGDLREMEKIVSQALSTHNTVKSSHEYLRHNLSLVSNKVQTIMNEQGIALTIIQEIMDTLNQSMLERQNIIDTTISDQIEKNAKELAAVHKIMRNFTTVIRRVLKSQISQNISHANIQRQQRTLAESVDFHDAAITDLLATSSKIETLVEGVRAEGKAYNLQMRNLVLDIENHERRLRVLDIADVALNQRVQKLNETEIHKLSELFLSVEKLEKNISSLNGILQSRNEENSVLREVLNHSVSELRIDFINLQTVLRSQNMSVKEIAEKSERELSQVYTLTSQVNAVLEIVPSIYYLQEKIQETRNFVSDQLQTMKQSLEHNSEITSKCNQSHIHLEAYVDQIKSQMDAFNTSPSVSPRQPVALVAASNECACNDDIVKKHSETMSDLKLQIEKLSNQDELLMHNISTMLLTQKAIDTTTRKIEKYEFSIIDLQSTTTQFTSKLDGLRRASRAQSDTLRRMENNNAEVISLVQTLQKNVLDHGSKITRETEKVEMEIASLANKIVSNNENQTREMESGRLHEIVEYLSYNLSVMENRLFDMGYNVEVNYNISQLVQVALAEHEVKISGIRSSVNSETYAIVASIASSVASLEYSVANINSTKSNDINRIEQLLEIFQLAFDTSNRQVAKYGEELEIIRANTSNQFSHFSTVTEYLTQIVKESSEVMTENRERINLMNETFGSILSHTSLNQANDSTNQLPLGLNGGESHYPDEDSYKQDGTGDSIQDSFNLEAVLNGDADSFRIHRRRTAWMNSEPSFEEEDYADNYDFESLERRKRVVKDVRKIGAQVTNVTKEIEYLRTKIVYLQNITFLQHISFSTGLIERFSCCGVVRFDKVFTNHGNAYDETTGKFKAFVHGNYIFMAAITQRNKFVSAVIVKNGEPQVSIRMDHAGGNYEQSQSTNSVILSLSTGDQVWMETNAGSLEGYQYPAVTFSGFMIM